METKEWRSIPGYAGWEVSNMREVRREESQEIIEQYPRRQGGVYSPIVTLMTKTGVMIELEVEKLYNKAFTESKVPTPVSSYPTGTVVKFASGVPYQKNAVGSWNATEGHCSYCMEDDYLKAEEADAKTDYEILSMPYGVIVQLAFMLLEEYGNVDAEGNDITISSIIDDAITLTKEQ